MPSPFRALPVMTLQSGRARRAINGPPAPFPRIKFGVPCCPFSCEDRSPLSPLPPCPFTRLARECSTHALGRRNPSTKGGWHQPSLMPSSFRKASKVSSRFLWPGSTGACTGLRPKGLFAPFAFRERFQFPGCQGRHTQPWRPFLFTAKWGQEYETARSQRQISRFHGGARGDRLLGPLPHARDVYLRLYSEQLRGDHLIDRLTRGTAFKQLGYSDR
jgi:hypothetical protein